MLPRGIQTKISLTLLGLLLTAMILVDLVLIIVIQNKLLSFENKRAEHSLQQLRKKIETSLISPEFQPDNLKRLLAIYFMRDNESCLAAIAEDRFFSAGACQNRDDLEKNIRQAMQTGKMEQLTIGKSWIVFQRGAQFISIAVPFQFDGQNIGGLGLMYPLTPFYSIIRRSQEIFVFYLIVNVILLSVGGYYIISRIFMRPIKRLVARAEQYDAKIFEKDEDLQFTVRLEDGELNKLSLALNQMMDRISKDREKLRENVAALEQANMELKQAQKEVVRAEKLASVGRLSAGIAHEIGNPIGIILGYLELLKSEEQSHAERQEFFSRAESEVLRINTIIKQLLNLSRPIKGEPEFFSIHSFLNDLIESIKVQPLLAETDIIIEANAAKDQVLADPEHLRQVGLNILINAADAIKSSANAGHGVIQINTELKEQRGQPLIEIRFSDNGIGISEPELGNIFDPFYTTKEPGKGTGLGLSVSLTIIEQMGGTLMVKRNQGGEGLSMIISLPVCNG